MSWSPNGGADRMLSSVLNRDGRDTEYQVWERPTAFPSRRIEYLLYLLLVLFLLWSAWRIRITPDRFVQGIGATGELIVEMFPPDFGSRQRELIRNGLTSSSA